MNSPFMLFAVAKKCFNYLIINCSELCHCDLCVCYRQQPGGGYCYKNKTIHNIVRSINSFSWYWLKYRNIEAKYWNLHAIILSNIIIGNTLQKWKLDLDNLLPHISSLDFGLIRHVLNKNELSRQGITLENLLGNFLFS